MRRLDKASKPKSGGSNIIYLKLMYYVIIPLINGLSYRLGFNKIIEEIMEIELMLNNDNTKFNKYKNNKKPPRIG
ncbi:MAG: hypothetical protein ACLQG5_08130 [Methanobacterium sp.]|jgi:hypothetical protein